ncbi:hypothetical protein [Flavobacterium sp.]|uniref:hypothetical protein n=1 Tax=Flavobacterium sp. TaxID=239 RepID=UPI00262066CA|nr:hypothetical protein [Flavobacterium sp.]MDD3003331.1 hypothetical protein [Flavobacterium sp.]
MKYLLTIVFCLTITSFFAQNKGINLIKNTSSKTKFIKEYRRIKVKTTDGKSIAGKFTVLNDSEISIKGRFIPIDSIASIRKASTFSNILRTTSAGIGTFAVVGGIAMVKTESKNDYYGSQAAAGMALMIVGVPFIIAPLTVNKHPVKKWEYEIVNE